MTTEAPTRILLIRHGINDYIQKGLLAGRTPGVHLNAQGQEQAAALAERFAATQLVAIYSSPLERTLETAAPIAQRLGLAVQHLDGLLESDCGEWTGRALEELNKTETWKLVQVQPSRFRFPGGESMAEIQARMVATLERLQAAHPGQTIAVVSHSDPIKLAVAYYLGMGLDSFQRLEVAPASVTELEFTPWRTRLLRLNDCAHLPPQPAGRPDTAPQP